MNDGGAEVEMAASVFSGSAAVRKTSLAWGVAALTFAACGGDAAAPVPAAPVPAATPATETPVAAASAPAPAPAPAPASAAAPATTAPPAPAAPPAPKRAGGAVMHVEGNATWHDYESGVAKAKAQGKPAMVLIYADWCPKCRALGPLFADAEFEQLAEKVVIIRADQEQNPPWLGPFSEGGRFVPRIFFLDRQGHIDGALTSGHARYPFFYAVNRFDALKENMRKAAGG